MNQTGNTIDWQALFTAPRDLLFAKKLLHTLRAYVWIQDKKEKHSFISGKI